MSYCDERFTCSVSASLRFRPHPGSGDRLALCAERVPSVRPSLRPATLRTEPLCVRHTRHRRSTPEGPAGVPGDDELLETA